MFEWEEADRFSFEDSDRFEEDSICSWISEPESVVNNWRGWRGQMKVTPNANTSTGQNSNISVNGFLSAAAHSAAQIQQQNAVLAAQVSAINESITQNYGKSPKPEEDSRLLSLTDLAAREVASSIPFELVEDFCNDPSVHFNPSQSRMADELQLRIAFWSFPEQEEDIRLYSCLANGSADEFIKGEHLQKNKAVKDPLQIGFHLSATVAHSAGGNGASSGHPAGKQCHSTSVKFDRKHVENCQCSCNSQAKWCSHVVALCLHRIHQPRTVKLRAPISESLNQLKRDQLQKFAQYLIYELPQQILPTAQKILDELLSPTPTEMNTQHGAPDPTLGGVIEEQSSWCLDRKNLRDNIKKILIKFCVPAPIVFSDVNYLSTTAPPSASEWCSFLRPLRGREPEGMWNLLSIVREMFKRNDRNSIPLLEIITQQCLETAQIMVWWFNTRVALMGRGNGPGGKAVNSNAQASQNACASLCDEIVTLWKLAAINPCIAPSEREVLKQRLINYHITVLEKIQANQSSSSNNSQNANTNGNSSSSSGNSKNSGNGKNGKPTDLEVFTGFKPAIEGCMLDWESYPIPGVTYGHNSHYLAPFAVFKLDPQKPDDQSSQINSSQAVLRCEYPTRPRSRGQSAGTVSGDDIEDKSSLSLNREGLEDGISGQQQAKNDSSSSIIDDARLLRHNSQDSSNSDFAMNLRKEINLNPEQNESGPGSFSSTSTSSSGEVSNPNRIDVEDEGVVEGNNNPSSSNNVNIEPEPSKQQEIESGNESAPEQLSRENSATEFVRAEDQVQKASTSMGEQNQYKVYFYDPKESVENSSVSNNLGNCIPSQNQSYINCKRGDVSGYIMIGGNKVDVLKNLRLNKGSEEKDKSEIAWDVKFMRAEGIHAHGYHLHALQMAVDLAKEMLQNPPNLGADLINGTLQLHGAVGKGKKKKVNPASHIYTEKASRTLAHCAFLCTVLSEHPDHTHLAFQIGMFGLEMARLPASTKPMEVRLAHQESELVTLLKRIPLGPNELFDLRERALQLREGKLRSRGEALLPLMLSSYIFESLMLATTNPMALTCGSLPTDEQLGFEAAVAALGLKTNVSEADHPLLCEGTRRQRGDLALLLLVHYKDQPERLAKIMEKILDKEVHQLFKAPILPNYYIANGAGTSSQGATQRGAGNMRPNNEISDSLNRQLANLGLEENENQALYGNEWNEQLSRHQRRGRAEDRVVGRLAAGAGPGSDSGSSGNSSGESFDSSSSSSRMQNISINVSNSNSVNHLNGIQNILPNIGPNVSAGAVGGSNPPYIPGQHNENRAQFHSDQNPTDTHGNSPSASLQQQTLPTTLVNEMSNLVRPTLPNIKVGGRYKGKRAYPSLPNQPSEALAHFMFELAKQVLTKAGGNSSTSLFTQPSTNPGNQRGPHRALHMCAFQLGLYALGLHNRVSPNWLSRTYSSHVSWINGQAMEIGASAINFLMATWQGHLTPSEAASIADKASKSRDVPMVRAAADLALSVLPQAAALNPNEIQRAIQQCREQSHAMLEKACNAVERASAHGSVDPAVMFEVGRHWYYLYEKTLPRPRNNNGASNNNNQRGDSGLGARNNGAGNRVGEIGVNAQQQDVSDGRFPNRNMLQSNPAMAAAAALAQFAGASGLNGNAANFQGAAAMAAAVGQMPSMPNHGASGPQLPPPLQFPGMPYPLIGFLPNAAALAAAAGTNPNFNGNASQNPNIPLQMYMPPNVNAATLQQAIQLQAAHALAQAATNQGNSSQNVHNAAGGVGPNGNSSNGVNLNPVVSAGLPNFPPPSTSGTSNSQQRAGLPGNPLYPFNTGFPLAPLLSHASNAPQQGASANGASANNNAAPGVAANAQLAQLAALNAALFPHVPPPSPAAALAAAAAAVQPLVGQAAHQGHPIVSNASGMPQAVGIPGGQGGNQGLPPIPDASGNGNNGNPYQAHGTAHSVSQRYLLSAYNVGINALEYHGRRLNEERPQVKFTRNPSYADDVKWLFSVAAELGLVYIQNFLQMVINRMVNPFLLHELAYECGKFYAHQINSLPPNGNPGGGGANNLAGILPQPHIPGGAMNIMHPPIPQNVAAGNQGNNAGAQANNQQNLRASLPTPPPHELIVEQIRNNPQLKQLMLKCYQDYYDCMRHKLYHLTPAEYDEFVSLLTYAKTCFQWTNEGPIYWSSLMKEILKSKACKKELRQKIQFASTNQTSGESTHMAGASNSGSSGAGLSGANNNPPNIGGAVGGMNQGAQGGLGNANNMHHPPPAL